MAQARLQAPVTSTWIERGSSGCRTSGMDGLHGPDAAPANLAGLRAPPRGNRAGMATSKQTTDHDTIRRWVEERGGRPARVTGTGGDGDLGLLRIDYPGRGDDDSLEAIGWDECFEAFEANGLAFVYQDGSSEGEESRFSKLVAR